jgi:hypothetical protein
MLKRSRQLDALRRALGAPVAAVAGLMLVIAFVGFAGKTHAQADPVVQPAARTSGSTAAHGATPASSGQGALAGSRNAEEGVRWNKLKPAQREALKSLQQQWPSIDTPRKQKWIALADRLPGLPADEQARVKERMAEWAKLSPSERGQVRARYQEARQVPLPDRRSRWEAYQTLPEEEKARLAARAAAERTRNASAEASARSGNAVRAERGADRVLREPAQAKSNIVPNPAFSARPRPVAPTVVQAGPGATTTFISRQPQPPAHQHTGLPKIAATPEFVNKSTLLPQRGPQSAAIRPIPPDRTASPVRP